MTKMLQTNGYIITNCAKASEGKNWIVPNRITLESILKKSIRKVSLSQPFQTRPEGCKGGNHKKLFYAFRAGIK